MGIRTLPDTTGFAKTLIDVLDLVCDCAFPWSAELSHDGLIICTTCGRYVPPNQEA